jgi:hypothetical protein
VGRAFCFTKCTCAGQQAHTALYIRKCKAKNSISNGAQYVTLRKYFSHPNLLFYFFPTPPIKLRKCKS